ncbi:hypothetical protein [Streptomyces rochei]|uniref:hypothetical protein n=1 Tax=Streptomyces rochei TaxID=1928 RepID=UPI0036B23D52
MVADSDEFHAFPVPLSELIAEAESVTGTVGGLMHDRIAADGSLPRWSPQDGGLDGTYPLDGPSRTTCSAAPPGRSSSCTPRCQWPPETAGQRAIGR